MGMHSYNFGLKTSGKGEIFESFSFAIGAAGAVGTILQAAANLVASVTHTGTGVYTVQLNAPYPPTLIVCEPRLSAAAANSAILTARYQSSSYSPTAGTFIINVTNATPAAADPASGDSIAVVLTFEQYTNMPS